MTSDLITRLSKLEGACGASEAVQIANQSSFKNEEWALFIEALRGSVDAASALAERVLPGWKHSFFVGHLTGHPKGKGARAEFHSPKKTKDQFGYRWPSLSGICYHAPTLPLAMCIAILLATDAILRAKEASHGE